MRAGLGDRRDQLGAELGAELPELGGRHPPEVRRRRAISVIGFVGSVFSPWYAWSGRRNPADHCCLNVVLYGRGGRRTMTDRGETALRQSPEALEIGPSRMHWNGTCLDIEIDERAVPRFDRLRGRIRVHPAAVTAVELPLTPEGAHVWRPFAPTAEIEVSITGRAGAGAGTATSTPTLVHARWRQTFAPGPGRGSGRGAPPLPL